MLWYATSKLMEILNKDFDDRIIVIENSPYLLFKQDLLNWKRIEGYKVIITKCTIDGVHNESTKGSLISPWNLALLKSKVGREKMHKGSHVFGAMGQRHMGKESTRGIQLWLGIYYRHIVLRIIPWGYAWISYAWTLGMLEYHATRYYLTYHLWENA